MTLPACPVCANRSTTPVDADVIFRCDTCGHWFSLLRPTINERSGDDLAPDLDVKEALRSIRAGTFNHTLDLLTTIRSLSKGRHLDVGCSIGQFLSISAERGMKTEGVEPEHAFAEAARREGHRIHEGYFPDPLGEDKRYDVISFMDVIGHIPDAVQTCRQAVARLNPGGLIVIKTPAADGVMFMIGRLMNAMGMRFLWNRLWQVDFASPQIHYFTLSSMERMAHEGGARIRVSHRLPSLKWKGLWQRMLPGKSMPYWKAAILYVVVTLMMPLFMILPGDSLLVVLEARPNEVDDD